MNKLLFIVFAAFSAACSDTPPLPADPQATPETRALYRNLFRIADEGVMFGHQDDALYGHDWKYEEGRSDVRECCGDYPAVFGWELGGLETGADRSIDDVPFAEITRLLCAAYGRGAVNTVSWHPQNPESGASAWDGKTSTAVSSILPGGANHAQFRLWLDRLAGFFVGLKSADGTCVPVLFRPFHEHTGSGFWWGEAQCTPDEYKALWRFTVEYLRDVKGVQQSPLRLFTRPVPRCGALYGTLSGRRMGRRARARRLPPPAGLGFPVGRRTNAFDLAAIGTRTR